MGPPRLELGTSTLSVWRSNQLSYEPASLPLVAFACANQTATREEIIYLLRACNARGEGKLIEPRQWFSVVARVDFAALRKTKGLPCTKSPAG